MKSAFASLLFSAAALCLVSATAASAQVSEKPLTRSEVEALVKKVIEENPDLIVRSVEAYQSRQQVDSLAKSEEKIASLKKELQQDPYSPSVGNPKGDVTVVEFFDYHCGYCKHFYPEVTRLLDDDKNIHFVFKEFPILSEDSETAAKAALAVYQIDKSKYFAFHSTLMKSSGQFTMESLTDTAKEAGISEADFKKAMQDPALDKELERTKAIAQALNVSGTPVLIIGNQLVPGAIDMTMLKQKVEKARKDAAKG